MTGPCANNGSDAEIMMPDTIKKSKAFQSLRTEAAREVFEIFLEKNSSRIMGKGLEFGYSEAEKLGISADRFIRAIDQLIEVGLIDILEKKRRRPNQFPTTVYALSNRWKNYGHKCFKYRERSKRKPAPTGPCKSLSTLKHLSSTSGQVSAWNGYCVGCVVPTAKLN